MDADDFQEVYKLLRGSRSATVVLDARALFLDNKMVEALGKFTEAREQFAESRTRLLKQDAEKQVDPKAKDADRQIKKLQRKQEKVVETLEAFDELIPALEKLANREKKRQENEEAVAEASAEVHRADAFGEELGPELSEAHVADVVARPGDVSKEFVEAFSSSSGDDRLNVITQLFGFQQVESEADILGNALYYIQTSKSSFLVSTPALEEMEDSVPLVSVVDERSIKPFSRNAFLKLGKRRKMVLLTKLDSSESSDEAATQDVDMSDEPAVEEPKILDMGAFSQLLTSAQRSGLVSGADQIGHVRDREFRVGKYDLAFQAIDSMYSRFTASQNQRLQKITREDAEIAAGRIKISPKDLQAKRARERSQTQEIDRAKRRFQVVLEGLRVLMHSD